MRKYLLLLVGVPLGVLTLPLASCADSGDAEAKNEPPGFDASPPIVTDGAASCDADCPKQTLPCSEADFCEVPNGADPRLSLFGVWGASSNDVWAAGTAGTVVHWDGTAWKKVTLPPPQETFFAVGGSAADDVWFVASPKNVRHTTGYRGDSTAFTREPSIDPNLDYAFGTGLSSILVLGRGDFVVAISDGHQGIFAWTDAAFHHRPIVDAGADAESASPWEPVSAYCQYGDCYGDASCYGADGVWGTSARDLWLIGPKARLLRRTAAGEGAQQWCRDKTVLANADFRGIWGSSASNVWIVGDRGTIRHWDNGPLQRWTIAPSPSQANLRAVWGSGPGDAWAVGDAGTILHWDGIAWSQATTTLPPGTDVRLYGVWGSGPSDVWAVGEGVALHFTGKKPGNPGAQ